MNRLANTLFWLGLATMAFSGIAGPKVFGEFKNELSTFFFLPALIIAGTQYIMAWVRRSGTQSVTALPLRVLPVFAAAILGVIFISFLANPLEVLQGHFRGRDAYEKFLSSLVAVLFGFGLALFAYHSATVRWQDFVARPLAWSAFICIAFSTLEMAARWGGVGAGIYEALSSVIHGGFPDNMKWDFRLRSVAFEPPWFGNWAGLIWPWLWAAWRTSPANRRDMRWFYAVALSGLTTLILLSAARTGLTLLATNCAVLFALRYIYLPPRETPQSSSRRLGTTILLSVLGLLVLILTIKNYGVAVAVAVDKASITNISRLASIQAAFEMFWDNPVFGLGFGQYGFHLREYLHYWAYYSYEFEPKLIFPDGPWPSSYSIYARLAAETGILGLVTWIGVWLVLAHKVAHAARAWQRKTNQNLTLAWPLIMNCFGVLAAGLATDSLRSGMMWVALGLGCRMIVEVDQTIKSHATSNQQSYS